MVKKTKKHNKTFFDLAFWGTQLIPSICGHSTTDSTPGLLNSGIFVCCFCFDKDRVSPRQLRLASDSGFAILLPPGAGSRQCSTVKWNPRTCLSAGLLLVPSLPSTSRPYENCLVFLCLDELKGILDRTVFLFLIFWGTGFCFCIISVLIYMFTNDDREFIFFPSFPLYGGTNYQT